MKDDTKCTLSEIRGAPTEPPLSARVVEMQKRATFVLHKTSMRLCVQVDMNSGENPSRGTGPVELRHHASSEYIAVSCPWSLPGHDAVTGRYRFEPADTPGVVMAPDAVLDRILNYKFCNPTYLHTPFWLDKLCINQEDGDEKEVAVHSMDLVYQYSGRIVDVGGGKKRPLGRTLGLLFLRIDSERKLWVLRRLLDSKLSCLDEGEPRLLVPADEVDEALDLVEEILSDSFWKRAWIFQEEFLASRHMVLLLPSSVDRTDGRFNNEAGEDLFGRTAGEIEVWPMNFRTEVTVLCLAASRGCGEEARRARCGEILRYARRYTFLYRSKFEGAGPSSQVRAMSPAILEDISARGITEPADLLAIAANCCRWNKRLSARELGPTASLSVAILTLALMNGEILRHDGAAPDESLAAGDVFACLRAAKLEVHPPVAASELIFIKHCRLPRATLTAGGLAVRAVLSRIDRRVRPALAGAVREAYWRSHEPGRIQGPLTGGEKGVLRALAAHLDATRLTSGGGDALASKLRDYADGDDGDVGGLGDGGGGAYGGGYRGQHWGFRHLQLLMAKRVCRALAEGRAVSMARLHVRGRWTPWLGVFVRGDDDIGQGDARVSFALTAVGTDHELTDRGAKLSRKNTWIASVEVRYDPRTGRVMPRRWINGLCFFNNTTHPSDLVIPWPAWMR